MLGFPVVAAHEAAVAQQPGQAGLDDPAMPTQPGRGLDPFPGDPHTDTAATDLAATPAGHTPCPRAACPADAEAGPGGNGSARTRPAAAATGGSRGCWRPTPARRGAAPAGRTARAASSPACPGRPGLARSAPPFL